MAFDNGPRDAAVVYRDTAQLLRDVLADLDERDRDRTHRAPQSLRQRVLDGIEELDRKYRAAPKKRGG